MSTGMKGKGFACIGIIPPHNYLFSISYYSYSTQFPKYL
jgi:hypothetical protein